MNRRPIFHRIVAVLVLGFACALAQAGTWCVDSIEKFQEALRAALDDDTTIKLVRGDYKTESIGGGTWDDEINYDLSILGGYSGDGCTEAGRLLDPSLTVFHPESPGNFYFGLVMDGDLLLKSLTFRGYGGGVQIYSPCTELGADDQWTLDRVRIERSGGTGQAPYSHEGSCFVTGAAPTPGLYVMTAGDADVTLQQVVIANNAVGGSQIFPEDSEILVKQSTFADNAGTGLYIGGDGDARANIDNNLFWGNACGLHVEGVSAEDLHMRYNTIDCNAFDELPSVNVGNDTHDPQFFNGDYRLSVSSPAIDAGINPPLGGQSATDIEGKPRVVGSGVDRGPWESDQSSATMLVVSNTNNSGVGSLRNAIDKSNTLPDTQIIRFDIPGACPQIVSVSSSLPDVSDSVRIEGYSQPGSVSGASNSRTICVGIRGNQDLHHLLQVTAGDDTRLDVSGLGFGGTGFKQNDGAIRLLAGSGHQITGNQFGGSIGPPGGNQAALGPLQHGVYTNAILSLNDSYIGGDEPAQRNVFNGSRRSAIEIDATSTIKKDGIPANLWILNNYIGLNPDGRGVNANGYGVVIGDSSDIVVAGNWISGNNRDGLVLRGAVTHDISVRDNDIGGCEVALCGEKLWGNLADGIRVEDGASNISIEENRIVGNGKGGYVQPEGNANALTENRIYNNGELGIDIGADGITPNNGSMTTNDGVQNHPVLGAATGSAFSGTVMGGLNTVPNRTYAIEIYASDDCDASGRGEGQRLIGEASVTTPQVPFFGFYSTARFEIPVSSEKLSGQAITALARSAAGDTSEFSPCVVYVVH